MIRVTNRLFGTQPIAAHCPGPPHDDWRFFCEAVLSEPRRVFTCRDLTILTWNSGSRPAKPCGLLERSLERLGVEPLVLGRDIANWRNILKFRVTAEALRGIDTPYVLGCDSADVVLFDDPKRLVDEFERHYTCELVFNATGSRCWPEHPEFVRFESSLPMAAVSQGRHWLNSGLFLGRTEFCREFFAAMAQEPPVAQFEYSDQAVIKRAWPRWYPWVQIDYLCLLFQWFNEDRGNLWIERSPTPRQQELIRLLRLLGDPITGAEVGVFDGSTADALLRAFPRLQLWLVDPWQPYTGKCRLDKVDEASFEQIYRRAMWWTQHAGDRRFVLRGPSLAGAARFAGETLDFAFIDANHLYEHVRSDLAAWWPKVRPGGYLTGHDYGVYGDADGTWGVRRAVDEFAGGVGRQVSVGQDGVWWLRK